MHSHHLFLHFLKNRELNELYLSISIRAFALSLIGIFVPIYLYQMGYTLVSIFTFYLFWSLFHVILTIPATKVSARIGLKHSMLVSIPFLIVFFMLLYTLETSRWPLQLLSFFISVNTVLFWMSYHTDFARFSDKKNRGREIAFSKVVAIVFGALGPVVGAFVLTFMSFKILFIVVCILLGLSIVPLFFTEDVHEPSEVSLKDFFKGQKRENVLAFVSNGIESRLGMAIWPLFIFLFIFNGKYLSLGLVSSFAMAVSLFSNFFIARMANARPRTTLKFGSALNAVVWAAKSFVVTPVQVFFVDALYGVSQTAIHIPFDTLTYDKARKNRHIIRLIAQREIYYHLGAILLFIVLILFTVSLTEIFRYVGSGASLLKFFF